MAKRSGKKVKSTGMHANRGAFVSVSVVVVLLVGILSVRCLEMVRTNQSYQETVSQLEAEKEALTAEQAEIEEYAQYIQTDEYVVEIARQKLGLVFPGEIIFRAEE